jgi:hypothetical protein
MPKLRSSFTVLLVMLLLVSASSGMRSSRNVSSALGVCISLRGWLIQHDSCPLDAGQTATTEGNHDDTLGLVKVCI